VHEKLLTSSNYLILFFFFFFFFFFLFFFFFFYFFFYFFLLFFFFYYFFLFFFFYFFLLFFFFFYFFFYFFLLLFFFFLFFFYFFFFFIRRYNPWWVLACFKISFHNLLSLYFSLQFLTFIFFKSSSTWSSHLSFGLPTGLDEHGSHSVTFLTVHVVSILITCAAHRNLCDFINI
jgi:hypothetical protein